VASDITSAQDSLGYLPSERGTTRRTSVLAIVLNWKHVDHTLSCVAHLQQQRGAVVDILVIDNGSGADCQARLQALADSCRLICLEHNLGFAEGMNVGIREGLSAGYDYLWLVNNDAFPEPDCLQKLLTSLRARPSLAMVSPRLLSADGTDQHVGGTIDLHTGEITQLQPLDFNHSRSPSRWMTGTAPVISSRMLRRVGLFERPFFAYMEDVDLSLRISKAGGEFAAVTDAVVVHLGSASSGSGSLIPEFLTVRNTWFLLERHAARGSRRARWLRFTAFAARRAAVHTLYNRPHVAEAVAAAVSAARRNLAGPPPALLKAAFKEAFLARHPWRTAQIMDALARCLEPRPDAAAVDRGQESD